MSILLFLTIAVLFSSQSVLDAHVPNFLFGTERSSFFWNSAESNRHRVLFRIQEFLNQPQLEPYALLFLIPTNSLAQLAAASIDCRRYINSLLLVQNSDRAQRISNLGYCHQEILKLMKANNYIEYYEIERCTRFNIPISIILNPQARNIRVLVEFYNISVKDAIRLVFEFLPDSDCAVEHPFAVAKGALRRGFAVRDAISIASAGVTWRELESSGDWDSETIIALHHGSADFITVTFFEIMYDLNPSQSAKLISLGFDLAELESLLDTGWSFEDLDCVMED